MSMEKTGEIKPGKTPDTEHRLPPEGEKKASVARQTEELDDDVTRRLADKASEKLG